MKLNLTRVCEHCEDGRFYRSRYGGNDPDTWYVGPCDACEGTGAVTIYCEFCADPAVEIVDDLPCCAVHAIEWKEELAL